MNRDRSSLHHNDHAPHAQASQDVVNRPLVEIVEIIDGRGLVTLPALRYLAELALNGAHVLRSRDRVDQSAIDFAQAVRSDVAAAELSALLGVHGSEHDPGRASRKSSCSSVDEVVRVAECSEWTVRRALRNGHLKGHQFGATRVWMINTDDVGRWNEARKAR
jgi:hypothetical protein